LMILIMVAAWIWNENSWPECLGGDSQLQEVPAEDVCSAGQGCGVYGDRHKPGQTTETLHDWVHPCPLWSVKQCPNVLQKGQLSISTFITENALFCFWL
jgi:hypothetical protein